MPNFYNRLRARKFSTAADTALEIAPYDSATPNFVIEAGGKLKWSSGSATADTTLYRSAANTLKTDDSFDIAAGKTYKIDGSDVLTATSLGSSVTSSSLTSLGTVENLSAATPSFTGPMTVESDNFNLDAFGNALFAGTISATAPSYIGPVTINQDDIFVSAPLNVESTMSFQQTTEKVNTSAISGNLMTCNYTTGAIYYQSTNPSANFTVNFTNVPTTNNRAITFTIFVTQGATAYLPNAVQIDGSAQTIKWAQGITPTPTASKIDIFSFTLIRLSNTWTVFGNANTNF